MELPARDAALERLDRFVGAWELEAIFPNNPTAVLRGGRSVFAWMKGRQLLVQRTEVPAPDAPDSIAIIAVATESDAYTQHYFDSRGVVRRYAMTLRGGVWTLLRERPDHSPSISRSASRAHSRTTATPSGAGGKSPATARHGTWTSSSPIGG